MFGESRESCRLEGVTVVDDFTHQGLMIAVAGNLTASAITPILEDLFQEHRRLVFIRGNNSGGDRRTNPANGQTV